MMTVRTRYAPSPTGFFHIGGARTALFNYLFARKYKGVFICRIEDTDIERYVEGGIESQLDNLDWMCISPDESIKKPGEYGPYIQSQKTNKYKALAQDLLNKGLAYRCFCTKEELQSNRESASVSGQTPKYNRRCLYLSPQEIKDKLDKNIPFVIRLKIDDTTTFSWEDLIRGKISVPGSALTDPVILKSNGIPTYNFAVVVDDYDMKITHVLRGEEHISNTPYQMAIKKALGYDDQIIQYGHLSIIVDASGKKLSKRDLTTKQFIEDYRKMGFLPVAINNFLALLGWTSKNNKEIFTLQELEQEFDEKKISKAPAFFDVKKLMWVGAEHIKKLTDDEYISFAKPFIQQETKQSLSQKDLLGEAMLVFKKQTAYATQLNDLITATFGNLTDKQLAPELQDTIKSETFNKVKEATISVINKIPCITQDNSRELIEQIKSLSGCTGKDFFLPLRIICIKQEHGPEMDKILYIVGKQQILKNINTLK